MDYYVIFCQKTDVIYVKFCQKTLELLIFRRDRNKYAAEKNLRRASFHIFCHKTGQKNPHKNPVKTGKSNKPFSIIFQLTHKG